MNLSTLIVALLGVAASTTVVNASSIPAPSRATASDWADVADEEWGNAGGEDLSDMQRRRLSTTAPSAAATIAATIPLRRGSGAGERRDPLHAPGPRAYPGGPC